MNNTLINVLEILTTCIIRSNDIPHKLKQELVDQLNILKEEEE